MLFSTENELPMPGLLTQRNLSFDLALEAATAALETARSRGYHVGVAVTDRSGQLPALLRNLVCYLGIADSGKPSARQIYGFTP